MIIDAHVHIHPRRDGFGERYDASVQFLVESMEDSCVDKAVLLAIEPEIPNSFIAEVCNKYPDKFVPFASVNPSNGKQAIMEIRKGIFDIEFKGIKLHPRRQNFGIKEISKVIPIMEFAAASNMVVTIDTLSFGRGIYTCEELKLVKQICELVPDVKIIVAHFGGFRIFEALMLAKGYRNIYLDLSLTPFYFENSSVEQDFFFAIKKVGADRCIYGSDHPQYVIGMAYENFNRKLDEHGFLPVEKEFIFSKTFTELTDQCGGSW